MFLFLLQGSGDVGPPLPPPIVPSTGAGSVGRGKARRKFMVEDKVYEGTEDDARRLLYALLDSGRTKPDAPKSKPIRRKRVERMRIVSDSPPIWIDTHKYQSLLLQARKRDDEWMAQILYDVWKQSMQMREEDDEETILWLLH